MAERLSVDPAELLRSADEHEQRAQGWRRIAANPPHDPDQLAHDLGFVGHQFTEAMRARNAQRAQDAENQAAGFEKDAHGLRAGAADYLRTDEGGAREIEHVDYQDNSGPGGIGPNGVGRMDDFQGGASSPSRGIQGPYDTDTSGGPAQVRPQFPGLQEGSVPAPSVQPDTPTTAGGGVQGPFDVAGYESAQVRPAGHTEPIDPSAGDYERLYSKLFPNPLPGQPGGGTWTDVAPSFGDANHPPHGGLIPNFPGEHSPSAAEPPVYTQVQPNEQGGYDIVAPGTDPANRNRTDGSR